MNSPQFQTLYENLRTQPDRSQMSLEQLREAGEQRAAQFPVPPDVTREPVDAGGVAAEWVKAPHGGRDGRKAVLLYFHGGGYYRGSVNTVREMVSRISRASGARVLNVDYRLAPEHPFPEAADDAVTAYRWLLAQGVAPGRIVAGGDSAGGGLTLGLLTAMRDAGEPLPAGAVCLSPWVDLAQGGASYTTRAAEDPSITASRTSPATGFSSGRTTAPPCPKVSGRWKGSAGSSRV